jgi:hypothetical protein
MNTSALFNRTIVISFLAISLFFLLVLPVMVVSLREPQTGASENRGFPFVFYSTNPSLGPHDIPFFSLSNLLFDMISYYLGAMAISYLITLRKVAASGTIKP